MEQDRVGQLPEPFNFYRLILKGDHLHFGLWPATASDLDLESAQEHMFERLANHLPKPPASVLDVGCGLGLSAHSLAQKGYQVTAIAPSRALIDYAVAHYGGSGVHFCVGDFLGEGEAGFLPARYDVILFQESLQYLRPLEKVFERARSLLQPKGVIVISDEICLDPALRDQTAVHPLKELVTALLENGFRITADQKVGPQVQQTCDHVIRGFTQNHARIVSAINRENTAARIDHFLNGWKSQQKWYSSGQFDYEILIARKDNLFVRAYRPDDENDILPLFNTVFSAERTLAHWYWKFRDNPFGAHKIAQAFTGDDILAGQYCGYPVPFLSSVGESRAFIAYQIGDTMTRPEFRNLGRGPTSVLARTTEFFYNKHCLDSVPFNYGYNTANIRKFGERFLHYQYIGEVPYHVLDLTAKKPASGGPLRRFFSGYSVEAVNHVSEEYNAFLERVAPDFGLLVKRDAVYLQWRYLDCPDREHAFFTVRRFGRIVGWGVFKIRGEVLFWGDALFDRRYPEAVNYLLKWVLQKNFSQAQRIEGWFAPRPGWWSDLLADSGFEKQSEPNKLTPCFKVFDQRFCPDFMERHFYYTMGDSDLF